MDILVVYESVFGNTHAVADAIADGARTGGAAVEVKPVSEAAAAPAADLLVVGGPTHMHGLASKQSRHMAVEAAREENHPVDPSADDGPGLRAWLRGLDGGGGSAAAFDTRADKAAALTGSAARGIARRLRHRGYEIAGRESFLVEDSEGPLEEGELDRARAWGAALAKG
jgi:Flavodoxin domain